MTGLYREFTLRGRADWAEAVATVRAAAPTMARAGRPLRVILADEDQDRLEEQVRFYWSAVIEPIAEQVWIDGRRFSAKAWHLHMKSKFLPARELRLPGGSIEFVQPSIARGEITVGQMAEYMTKVAAHAAADLGVQFDSGLSGARDGGICEAARCVGSSGPDDIAVGDPSGHAPRGDPGGAGGER